MRINRTVLIDIATNEVEYRDSFRYEGPLEYCGPDSGVKDTERSITGAQQGIAGTSAGRSEALNQRGISSLDIAKNWYDALSSGDPKKIFSAIAPAAGQISTQTEGAKKNIMTTMPRGGEQRLALENADVAKSAQIGDLATKAYTSAPAAEANLGTSSLGLSINQLANALAGYQGAAGTVANLGQQEASGKAATMGLLGSLAGAAGTVGAAAIPA